MTPTYLLRFYGLLAFTAGTYLHLGPPALSVIGLLILFEGWVRK